MGDAAPNLTKIPAIVRVDEDRHTREVELTLEPHEYAYLHNLTDRAHASEKGSEERTGLVNEMYVFAELKHFCDARMLTDDEVAEREREQRLRSRGLFAPPEEVEVAAPTVYAPADIQMSLGEQPDRSGSRGGSQPPLTLERARELFESNKEAEMAYLKGFILRSIDEKGEYHADDSAHLQFREPNVIGAAVSALVNGGLIESTGEHRRGSSPANHGRRSYVYRRKS